MISVSVPKEISDYKEKVIFGLSLRQLVCGVIAVGLAVATGLLLVQVLGLSIDIAGYPNQKFLTKSLRKLARLQRQLSRKSKGSKRREKARVKVARLQEHISNQRQDTLHKLSTQLVRDYDLIAIEDLSLIHISEPTRP